MYVLDTNVVLEMLRDREKSSNCREVMQKAYEGDIELLLPSFNLHGVEAMTQDRPERLEKLLKNIRDSLGIEVKQTSTEEEIEAVNLSRDLDLTFEDALQIKVARLAECQGILSYDTDFDSTAIERLEPRELL